MPRYFFHVINGHRMYRDSEGVSLDDIEAVHEWAVHDAQEVMFQKAADVESWSGWWIEVRDEANEQVLALPFLDGAKGKPSRSAAAPRARRPRSFTKS